MSAYLDASALVPMLVTEPGSDAIDAFLARCEATLVVSEFAAAEVASALSRLVRTSLMTAEEAAASLADFDSWHGG